jgi:hypothetical protein
VTLALYSYFCNHTTIELIRDHHRPSSCFGNRKYTFSDHKNDMKVGLMKSLRVFKIGSSYKSDSQSDKSPMVYKVAELLKLVKVCHSAEIPACEEMCWLDSDKILLSTRSQYYAINLQPEQMRKTRCLLFGIQAVAPGLYCIIVSKKGIDGIGRQSLTNTFRKFDPDSKIQDISA